MTTSTNLTRIYKYALSPTDMQRAMLEEAGIKSRVLWNKLLHETFHAIEECKHGRRASIINKYNELIASKKLVGQRVSKVKSIAIRDNISSDEALKKLVSEKTTKDVAIALRKDGTRYIRYSNKHLARLYAAEKVNQLQSNILKDGSSSIWYGIMSKWNDFCPSWEKGTFSQPRFKKKGQISALQRQVQENAFKCGEYVNLSWCGSKCLEDVKCIYDRQIPDKGIIKQIALTKSTNGRWFLCVFISADKSVFERKFTSSGTVGGIDPGFKSALTTSDGQKFTPKGLSKHSKQERKLKRIQRKLDRQTRANNTHCFNDDGTWKRGQHIKTKSRGMLESTLCIAEIKRYFNDAKSDYYHNAAISLLNQYDSIGIGNAKMHTLARGHGNSKRASNRRSREHAIADFIAKLKDKANLSLTPKEVSVINEAYTTQTCSKCNEKTGPTGIGELGIRTWKCSGCGTEHDRDVNSAINIKKLTISEMKAAAAQSVSDGKPSKVRRSTKGKIPERIRPRSMEINNSQEVDPMSIPFTSAQVMNQLSVDARILQPVVTLGVKSIEQEIQQSSPQEIVEHSQSQEDKPINQALTSDGSQ